MMARVVASMHQLTLQVHSDVFKTDVFLCAYIAFIVLSEAHFIRIYYYISVFGAHTYAVDSWAMHLRVEFLIAVPDTRCSCCWRLKCDNVFDISKTNSQRQIQGLSVQNGRHLTAGPVVESKSYYRAASTYFQHFNNMEMENTAGNTYTHSRVSESNGAKEENEMLN